MNIDESILSKLTDEQKKRSKPQRPRKNCLPLRKRPAMNCPRTNWKQSQAAIPGKSANDTTVMWKIKNNAGIL